MRKFLVFIFALFFCVSAYGQVTQTTTGNAGCIHIYLRASAPIKGNSYPLAAKLISGLKNEKIHFVYDSESADYVVSVDAFAEKKSESKFTAYDGSSKVMYLVCAKATLEISSPHRNEIVYSDYIEPKDTFRDSDYNTVASKAYSSVVPMIVSSIKNFLDI